MTENTATETFTASSDEAKARFSEEYMEANRIVEDHDGNLFVAIDPEPGTCACGCGEQLASEKRNFRPGHDQRLMGILVRGVREGLEITWTAGGLRIGGSAEDYGRQVLNENGQAKLARYLTTEPKRARRGRKASAAATPAVEVKADPLPATVKVGRWEYPVTDVERDANGKVVKVHYTNKRNEAMSTTSWNKLV